MYHKKKIDNYCISIKTTEKMCDYCVIKIKYENTPREKQSTPSPPLPSPPLPPSLTKSTKYNNRNIITSKLLRNTVSGGTVTPRPVLMCVNVRIERRVPQSPRSS